MLAFLTINELLLTVELLLIYSIPLGYLIQGFEILWIVKFVGLLL